MPPSSLDFSKRAELTELMDEPCSREVLRACLQDLSRVNRWFLGYRPTLRWLDSLELHKLDAPVRIVDVGCGYGDTLRRIEAMGARARDPHETNRVRSESGLGCDRSGSKCQTQAGSNGLPLMSSTIKAPSPSISWSARSSRIIWLRATLCDFSEWMEEHARVGWFINDLVARADSLSPVQSVFKAGSTCIPLCSMMDQFPFARAFVPDDWRRMCAAAGLQDDEFDDRGLHSGPPVRGTK